jgi:hypothetical protein
MRVTLHLSLMFFASNTTLDNTCIHCSQSTLFIETSAVQLCHCLSLLVYVFELLITKFTLDEQILSPCGFFNSLILIYVSHDT